MEGFRLSKEAGTPVTHWTEWTPRLIRRLRGKRSLREFGLLLGAPKNTVWRWETGRAKPLSAYASRLSRVAEREHFLEGWKLVGSMTLLGDLESANAAIAALFLKSIERTSLRLTR